MSSRRARKASNPLAKAPEPIITRTKSAQRKRQQKNKEDKKTEIEKPELIKPEKISPKVVKTVKRKQESLLKVPIVELDEDTQVEYYPTKLKRNVAAKKVMLKPKHNFKVIATTNKRKLATPQRGIKSPSSKYSTPNLSKLPRRSKIAARACSSPELSMQDMVRMMEETRSLSDEDFMEILTCPSPVWWEDPPDGGSDDGSIPTKSPEPPPDKLSQETKKRKLISKSTTSSDSQNSNIIILDSDSENPKEVDKITEEKFVKKKQKLENILGNIKNKTIQSKTNVKNTNVKSSETNDKNKHGMSSESKDKNKNGISSETNDKNTNRELPETGDKHSHGNISETDNKNTIRKVPENKLLTETDIVNTNKKISETDYINRKLSESEGDFSDLSYNEEEILKNLEEMEIPMEQTQTESIKEEVTNEIDDIEINKENIKNEIDDIQTNKEDVKSEIDYIQINKEDIKIEIDDKQIQEELIGMHNNEIAPKNDNLDREILSIEIKKEIKEEFLLRSPVFHKDSIANSSCEFRSDDSVEEISFNKKSEDIVIFDSSTSSSLDNTDEVTSIIDLVSSNSDLGKKSPKDNSSNVPIIKTKDLSKFITVYKITSDQLKNGSDPDKQKLLENTKTTKLETVKGKLNDFFKQCKSNLRLKKNMENTAPAIALTDVKEDSTDNEKRNGDSQIELEDEKNRLNNCDYCIEKTEKGVTEFSCEKCEMAPCDLCNIVAGTKDVDKTHVSSCKDVARISWSHNYVLNQT